MDTMQRLKALLQQVFEGELDENLATPTARLREDLGMDSIGMLYMAMAIEEEFGVRLTSDDLQTLTTVENVIDLLER